MSDYPMLISNKLHSFRNFVLQMYGPQPDNTRRHINVSHLHQCKYYYKTNIY